MLDNQYAQANDVVGPGTAFLMTSILQDVITKGTGYPNAIIGRPAAGKTGTTSDFRDAWFVGYTPDLVTAVWLGNDDYSRMYESYGGNGFARPEQRIDELMVCHQISHRVVDSVRWALLKIERSNWS